MTPCFVFDTLDRLERCRTFWISPYMDQVLFRSLGLLGHHWHYSDMITMTSKDLFLCLLFNLYMNNLIRFNPTVQPKLRLCHADVTQVCSSLSPRLQPSTQSQFYQKMYAIKRSQHFLQ